MARAMQEPFFESIGSRLTSCGGYTFPSSRQGHWLRRVLRTMLVPELRQVIEVMSIASQLADDMASVGQTTQIKGLAEFRITLACVVVRARVLKLESSRLLRFSCG